MAGRRTKLELNPELVTPLLAVVATGGTLQDAAAQAGIHRDTVYEYISRGKLGEEPFATFVTALDKAKAEAKSDYLNVVRTKALSHHYDAWKAAAWWLERRFPTEYGNRVQVEADMNVGPKFDLDKLSDEELQTWRALAVKAS